jgi:hypothetical protein
MPRAEDDGIAPAGFETGAASEGGTLGAIGGIRPTGFLPIFLSPTGGGLGGLPSFSPIIGGGGGAGGGSGGGSSGGGSGGGSDGPGWSGGPGGPPGGDGGPGPPPQVVPEPSTLVLASLGGLSLLASAWLLCAMRGIAIPKH